jgi:glycine dehydrogenase
LLLAARRMCATAAPPADEPNDLSGYTHRHIGPTAEDTAAMLAALGAGDTSLAALMARVVPAHIVRPTPMEPFEGRTEAAAIDHLKRMMAKNVTHKSLIGHGYYEPLLPAVIQRNVLESPGWYTPYTPYQAEIAQGRLEALLNFQTVITEITGMDIANASLLDEATAASEAMMSAIAYSKRQKRDKVFVDHRCFPATLEMLRTRAAPVGITLVVDDVRKCDLADKKLCAIIVQTPDVAGALHDFSDLFAAAKAQRVVCCCATDLMAATVTKPAGEMGADIVFGNAQRFGVPLGYGGPHPAFFAIREAFKRQLPGRLIGVSKDADGRRGLRMAMQTREQHIKRDNAISNICTAQALLANMAGFYGVYHGPDGLRNIARKIHSLATSFALGVALAGHAVANEGASFFDTVTVELSNGLDAETFMARCEQRRINVGLVNKTTVCVAFDEATTGQHLLSLLEAAGLEQPELPTLMELAAAKEAEAEVGIPKQLRRASAFMMQPIFNTLHDESSMMRYIYMLQRKDFGLSVGMVPLGSCTMKLNAAATMLPMSWDSVGNMHPYAPVKQAGGYHSMALALEERLKSISGFAAVSLQPNSGSQGEYAGLRAIRAYLASKGEGHRDLCLVPSNAHGTNPASAVLAGLKIATVNCLEDGQIDIGHLRKICEEKGKRVAAIMVTYPSTYGVFDQGITDVTKAVHDAGGQVYIDGANFNAMVGHTGPAFFGGDVCHFNLHKTFAIPHGGGGPGMGPIGVAEHLAPFLPTSVAGPRVGGSQPFGIVSQSGYGSASILSITYMFIEMLGSAGLKRSTDHAVLAANYLMTRLKDDYPILYVDKKTGACAHEFILDVRAFKKTAGIEAEDIAKRLMDYNFHAPTLSFPVTNTLMVEPTESESKAELDRFVDAMKAIRAEIRAVEDGAAPQEGNVLKMAPHTALCVTSASWGRPYSRQEAAYPVAALRDGSMDKFWPMSSRIDSEYGDLNLFCACGPVDVTE